MCGKRVFKPLESKINSIFKSYLHQATALSKNLKKLKSSAVEDLSAPVDADLL